MRRLLSTLLIALMTALHPSAAGVLTIVAPAAPGGGWDQTARLMQEVLTQVEPGARVQVENVAGAAGTIGLARFVTAERGNPDALLVTGLVMVSGIVSNGSPVSLNDTTPIARLTGEFEAIVVPAGSPFRTLADLVAAFKAAPASIAWGGGSAGGTDDLLVRLLAEAVGVPPNEANYIAFPGGGAALAALLGGQVSAGVSGYGEFGGQIAAGTLRLLAISAPDRVAGIDAPTLRESGIALDLANWRGVVAPPGLTDAERDALTARVERLARSDAWRAVLARNGWADLLLTGAAFRQFLIGEQSRIDAILRRLQSEGSTRAGIAPWRLTPMTLPWIAVAGLFGLVVVQLLRAKTKKGPGPSPVLGGPLFLILTLIIHAIAMPMVGFVPASVVLFVIAARLLGSARLLRDAAIGLVAASLLYAAFTLGLGVALPADPVTRWLTR